MKSRLLVGVGAWLLGAAAATSGSMLAVNQLAHGLLGPQTQQLTEAAISSANPDARTDLASPSAAARPSSAAARPTGAAARAPSAAARSGRDASATRRVNVDPSASGTPSPSHTAAGTLLQSPDGSVTAACQPAGAYLMYWSPDQGFHADDVFRGPAAIASVTFESPANRIVMRVSCKGGSPVARLSRDE